MPECGKSSLFVTQATLNTVHINFNKCPWPTVLTNKNKLTQNQSVMYRIPFSNLNNAFSAPNI